MAGIDDTITAKRRRRFKRIPLRLMAPNLVTLMALCFGLTSIRLAIEGDYRLAIGAVVFAAILDGLDGRVARLLKSSSRFGAELDSLTDFVNFGVAPAILLYTWTLHDIKSLGWIAALVFAISAGLRLARFNVALDDPDAVKQSGDFFIGVPAPAGAIIVLLPVYLAQLGVAKSGIPAWAVLVYVLIVAYLMISRLPTWSGKNVGKRVPTDMVVWLLIGSVAIVALLISYPFELLTLSALAYIAALPLGLLSWWRLRKRREIENEAALDDDTVAGDEQDTPSADVVSLKTKTNDDDGHRR